MRRHDSRFAGLEWKLGACVATFYDEDDVLRAQPDALGDNPQVEAYELHSPFGSLARPFDSAVDPDGKPTEGQMCNLLTATEDGGEQHAWLAGDPRIIARLPLLKHGERIEYGSAGQFTRYHADGGISHFTTDDGTPDGRSVYSQVRPDGFRWVGPWGKLVFDATGFHVLTAGGARIDLGSIGGLPAPLDALTSYAKITAAIIQQEFTVAAEGSVAGIPEPIAKATSTLAALTAIQAALTAIGASLTALGNGSAGAAITASGTALAASAVTLPSASKQIT